MPVPKIFLASVAIMIVALLTTPQRAFAFEEAMDELAATLAERIEAAGKQTVAVVDFTDVRGGKTELGRFLAEEVSVALLGSPRSFQVVDRAHLNRIIEETQLGESGVVDPDTAKELGRIAGVDALVTGTLTPLEGVVRLTVKVLETETANIIAGDRVSLSSTGPIRELLARGLAGSSSPSPGSDPGHTRAYEMESREAGGLRVTLRSLRILKNNQVAALMEIRNLNSYPVRVGLPGGSSDSQCIDNNGNLFRQDTGIAQTFQCHDSHGLTVAANEAQQVTEIYRGDQRADTGTIFHVTMHLKVCRPQDKERRDGRLVQFSFADLRADALESPSG